MLDKNLILQIQNALKKEQNILAVYVFGSLIKGDETRESDFDIAFVVRNKKDTTDKKIYEFIKDIHFPKDLDISVVDKSSSPLFLFQIVSTGKRIYEKSENLANSFEAYILNNYYDTQHLRNIYYKYLKSKFLDYERK